MTGWPIVTRTTGPGWDYTFHHDSGDFTERTTERVHERTVDTIIAHRPWRELCGMLTCHRCRETWPCRVWGVLSEAFTVRITTSYYAEEKPCTE